MFCPHPAGGRLFRRFVPWAQKYAPILSPEAKSLVTAGSPECLLPSVSCILGEMEQEKFTKVTMMKLKLKSMLAGAIALTVAAAPLAVKAQPNQPNQPARGQAQNQPRIAGVEITQKQQQQLAEIRRDTRAQVEKLLTPQQRQQFKAAIDGPRQGQSPFAGMNLSEDQQTKLQAIVQSAQYRAEAILTPEQRQQIQQRFQQQQPKK